MDISRPRQQGRHAIQIPDTALLRPGDSTSHETTHCALHLSLPPSFFSSFQTPFPGERGKAFGVQAPFSDLIVHSSHYGRFYEQTACALPTGSSLRPHSDMLHRRFRCSVSHNAGEQTGVESQRDLLCAIIPASYSCLWNWVWTFWEEKKFLSNIATLN